MYDFFYICIAVVFISHIDWIMISFMNIYLVALGVRSASFFYNSLFRMNIDRHAHSGSDCVHNNKGLVFGKNDLGFRNDLLSFSHPKRCAHIKKEIVDYL